MPYLVQKPIPAGEVTFQPGEVVHAEGWRNVRSLIAGRYLSEEPVAAAPKPASKPAAVVEPVSTPKKAAAPVKAARAKRTTSPSTPEE